MVCKNARGCGNQLGYFGAFAGLTDEDYYGFAAGGQDQTRLSPRVLVARQDGAIAPCTYTGCE
jgi:hypothetical protein